MKSSGILFIGFGDLTSLVSEAYKRFPKHEIISARTVKDGLTLKIAEHLFVYPVYLLPGFEYEKVCGETSAYGGQISVGKPLLYSEKSVNELTDILLSEYREENLLFVGHGSDHPAGHLYRDLNQKLQKQSGGRTFLSLLSGNPGFVEAKNWIEKNQIKRVRLIPLMMNAGKHVQIEILGDKESWRTRLEKIGVDVIPVNYGLCDYPAIREMIFSLIV